MSLAWATFLSWRAAIKPLFDTISGEDLVSFQQPGINAFLFLCLTFFLLIKTHTRANTWPPHVEFITTLFCTLTNVGNKQTDIFHHFSRKSSHRNQMRHVGYIGGNEIRSIYSKQHVEDYRYDLQYRAWSGLANGVCQLQIYIFAQAHGTISASY